MIYILAILVPPLALLFYGKVFQALMNAALFIVFLLLTILSFGGAALLLLIPIFHAIVVIHGAKADERTDKIVEAIKGKGRL